MNRILIFAVAWALASSNIADAQTILDSIQRLRAVEKADGDFDPAAYLEITNQALHAWDKASEEEKMRFSSKMFLVHFRRAQIMAATGNFKAAADELRAEAVMQKDFEGRLEFATKSPDAFFRDLVELQAQLTAETGSDPLADQVGYSFERDGDGFTAARLELGDDISGITVPEIGADEALALVHRLDKQGGKFVATASRWLVVPKGRLPDVLKQAIHEVAFDSDGRMTVHSLKAHAEPSSKADPSVAANMASPEVPSHVQPPSPKKALEAMPTPIEKPTSSTPWSIVVMLIVAVLGLLWLLLKKRK